MLEAVERSRRVVAELVDDLRWSDWKRCRDYSISEIWFLPMWSIGQTGDYHRPRCIDESRFERPYRDNY